MRSPQLATAPAAQPVVTIAALVEGFLISKRGPDASAARSYHGQKSANLARLMGGIAMHELTAAEVTLCERKRRADHASERTIREELKVLRQALERGVGAGLVERAILDGLGMQPGRAGPRSATSGTP